MREPATSNSELRRSAAEAALRSGRIGDAVGALKQTLIAAPGDRAAVALLVQALERLGEHRPHERAAAMVGALELHDARLRAAAAAVAAGEMHKAELLVRAVLAEEPEDPSALRLLAQLATLAGDLGAAEQLLRHVLELAPDFARARFDEASLLYQRSRFEEAVDALDTLIDSDSSLVGARMLKAAALSRLGRTDEALSVYEAVLADAPGDAAAWTLYGHALRTRGRRDDSIAAYRRAIAIEPGNGLAWFSLANLKTVQLAEGDAAEIETVLAQSDLSQEDRIHLHFALGKAAEDLGETERSFRHYAAGNRIVNDRSRYEASGTTDLVTRCERLFDGTFYARRKGWGAASNEPIFILGMPRAGSTLVEQILASHPLVEGTAELPYIPQLSAEVAVAVGEAYPECLLSLDHDQFAELGREYLARAGAHRRAGRPLFIDKNPPNWLHIGFIRSILPQARIVDVRRHPLACGFSNFKQHFAHGEGFSYSLENIGAYYRDYVRLLRHFDRVLPGSVHRLVYERLIDHPEEEVRHLLAHLHLPFDEACLRFWETERVVRTFSSEQVRQPLNRLGLDQWQAYEDHLLPLKQELGPVLEHYPEATPQSKPTSR